jgi:hypothetical protein
MEQKKTQISGGVGIFTSRLPLMELTITIMVSKGTIEVIRLKPNMPNFNPSKRFTNNYKQWSAFRTLPGNVGRQVNLVEILIYCTRLPLQKYLKLFSY